MKIRNGFVSNSSSSSFLIKKNKLDGHQIDCIKNHITVAKEMGWDIDDYDFIWQIGEINEYIAGSTRMDNFDMVSFLNVLNIKDEDINYVSGTYEIYAAQCDGDFKIIFDFMKEYFDKYRGGLK